MFFSFFPSVDVKIHNEDEISQELVKVYLLIVEALTLVGIDSQGSAYPPCPVRLWITLSKHNAVSVRSFLQGRSPCSITTGDPVNDSRQL